MLFFVLHHPILETTALVFALALAKGGIGDKLALGLFLGTNLLSLIPTLLLPRSEQITGVFVPDGILAAGLLLLALRYSSLWIGAAMLAQSASFALQAAFMNEKGDLMLFYIADNSISWFMLACALTGVLTSWRRRVLEREAAPAAPALAAQPAG
jgi:hypothetical protein